MENLNVAHTPGPWKIHEIRSCPIRIHDSKEHLIAQVASHATSRGSDMAANAHLVAAAPKLLEALKMVKENIKPYFDSTSLVMVTINEAIASAKGK